MVRLLVPALLLSACAEDVTGGFPLPPVADVEVAILEPAAGSAHGGARLFVRGTIEHAGSTYVEVNGVAAPAEGGTFAAWVDSVDGENTVVVVHPATGASASVVVLVDKRPPLLTVSSPARGTFVAGPQAVSVSLTAYDEGGLSAVTVGGEALDLNAGPDWTTDWAVGSGPNTLVIEAVDALGNVASEHLNVVAGPFGGLDDELEDAVVVHLGPSALRSFEAVVAAAADALDYTALAAASNPIVDSSLATVTVGEVTIAPGTQIGFETAPDRIRMTLVLFDWSVEATVTIPAVDTTWDGALHVPKTTVIVPIDVQQTDGVFTASIDTPTFDFESPQITLSDPNGNAPGTAVVEGPVLQTLEQLLTDTALQQGVALMDQTLAMLTTPDSRTIGGFDVGVQLTALEADVDDHGLELRLSGHLNIAGESIVPPEGDPGPVATASDVDYRPRSDIATVAMSDDLLNTLAYGLWRVGGLSKNVNDQVLSGVTENPLIAGFLTGLLDPKAPIADPEAPLSIALHAPLPPIVAGVEPGDAVGIDVQLDLKVGVQPPITGHLTAAFTAAALSTGDVLKLLLDTEHTTFDLSVGDPEIERRLEATFEPTAKHLLGELGPLFDALIGAVPVPQLGAFRPVNLSVSADGTKGQYVVLRGGLRSDPD